MQSTHFAATSSIIPRFFFLLEIGSVIQNLVAHKADIVTLGVRKYSFKYKIEKIQNFLFNRKKLHSTLTVV